MGFQWNAFVPGTAQEIFDYCVEHGISITGYYSLGGSLQKAQASTVETLQSLAEKYEVSVSKLMLRWSIQRGTAVIPGTGNPKHMKENLEVYAFEINEEDMQAINALRESKLPPSLSTSTLNPLDRLRVHFYKYWGDED